MTEANQIAAAELEAFLQRIEAQNARIKDEQDAGREIYTELAGRGYCKKTVRKIVAMRKLSADKRAEEEAVLDTYLSVLGLV